jgi:phage-related protein
MKVLEIIKQCSRELSEWPEEVKEALADAVARLERGHILSMPLSRPMPSIGSGVHELRFRDKSGIYRVVYWFAGAGRIWLIHAFKKKSQATPKQNIETAKERLKRILK